MVWAGSVCLQNNISSFVWPSLLLVPQLSSQPLSFLAPSSCKHPCMALLGFSSPGLCVFPPALFLSGVSYPQGVYPLHPILRAAVGWELPPQPWNSLSSPAFGLEEERGAGKDKNGGRGAVSLGLRPGVRRGEGGCMNWG